MSVEITLVRRDHFDEWLRMRQIVYSGVSRDFQLSDMRSIFEDDAKQCFLAIANSAEVCGMIEVSLRNIVDGCLTSPVGYIEGIYIDPPHRRAGLSRQLLKRADEWFRSEGCREVATDAELSNKEAQRFHEHMGFEETYRIVEYRRELEDN